MLANAGIVERTDPGAVEFPYDRVHVAFDRMAAGMQSLATADRGTRETCAALQQSKLGQFRA